MLHDIRKMKKKSDRSYLWEHPFGKRYVPQETKMLQTRSPSFTDDCGHSLQGRPVSPPHKWHLSRRCAETSRQWPTRQAVWAFGHPFGNIKNHNTEKKTWLEIIQCYTSKPASLHQQHKHIELLFRSVAELFSQGRESLHLYIDATRSFLHGFFSTI